MLKTQSVPPRFSTFSTNAMLKTVEKIQIVIRRKSALMRGSFFMGAGRKKGKLRVLRGYPQSFFICRTYPCICCLYPFGAHDTPSRHAIPHLDASSPEIVCSKKEMPSLRCAPISLWIANAFASQKLTREIYVIPRRFFKADPFIFYSSIR